VHADNVGSKQFMDIRAVSFACGMRDVRHAASSSQFPSTVHPPRRCRDLLCNAPQHLPRWHIA